MENKRYPLPPFTIETALQKVKAAEDAWNTKDPEKVSLAYTVNTEWRNRTDFINGREAVKEFLTRKWQKELDYKLKKELWGFRENRIAVRFEYEWMDHTGQWPKRLCGQSCRVKMAMPGPSSGHFPASHFPIPNPVSPR